ncbi:hypothetical protein VAEKB19_1640003 [Vibrio aestuarianus]|nr:hypothetical protein VAEKB19_1640003 [Vibrio aestuarianus]
MFFNEFKIQGDKFRVKGNMIIFTLKSVLFDFCVKGLLFL